MLQEAVAVMKQLKLKVVDLPGTQVTQLASGSGLFYKRFVMNKVVGGRGNRMPSFYADISSGKRKNEVVFHNGAIAEAGKAAGIYTPVNKAYSDIVMMLAYKRLNWQDYDGRPQRLFADVKRVAEQMKQQKATGMLG
jgi:ketopantoate reductase